ncbi:hypothetical protein FG386_002052 [Cryptosporidium ryanae]|uniref:uncharacterized protein n=1 Tax=Cryptosporidium ryanae TaxID=515981 RepID=UPI00351A9EC4|nr:hypothetical protein FG386_002052 [Cryptosporidium ryanae]
MCNTTKDDLSEWSDSSYSLRRRYSLNWSAIIREIPEDLELDLGLEETFSKWSVSQGYSLPNSVEIKEEMCILKGIRKAIVLSFPSRSSTRSFIRLSKRSIWEEISKDSTCELYVYCVPPFSFKPLLTMESMNVSTNYWLIRGISGEVVSEEAFWDFIGRGNRFGEHLRKVVYIRDERRTSIGFSNMGFCFLQFSSPLTSYRALRWQLKQETDKRFSKPIIVGKRHVQAMLSLVGKLDKYETKTLEKLRVALESEEFASLSTDTTGQRQVSREYLILRNYLRFWTKSHINSIPLNKNIEFFLVESDENAKKSFANILSCCDPTFEIPGGLKLYYSKHLNVYWDWNSRIFLHIQNKSVFEYDYELSSLVCISNIDTEDKDNDNITVNKNKDENNIVKSIVKSDIDRRNKSEESNFAFRKSKIHSEKERFVASLIETTKMQLSKSSITGGTVGNCTNSTSLNNKKQLGDSKDKNFLTKKRSISEFFDISSIDHSDVYRTRSNYSHLNKKMNDNFKRIGGELNNSNIEEKIKSDSIKEYDSLNNLNLCGGNSIEADRTIHGKQLELVSEDKKAELEDLICFVCCRIFNSLKEKISHEQSSLLHKYNLENSDP